MLIKCAFWIAESAMNPEQHIHIQCRSGIYTSWCLCAWIPYTFTPHCFTASLHCAMSCWLDIQHVTELVRNHLQRWISLMSIRSRLIEINVLLQLSYLHQIWCSVWTGLTTQWCYRLAQRKKPVWHHVIQNHHKDTTYGGMSPDLCVHSYAYTVCKPWTWMLLR